MSVDPVKTGTICVGRKEKVCMERHDPNAVPPVTLTLYTSPHSTTSYPFCSTCLLSVKKEEVGQLPRGLPSDPVSRFT